MKALTPLLRGLRTIVPVVFCALSELIVAAEWASYPETEGPGKGKHVVFICGDWEYRCEEGLPMLAKILSQRHGFKCTVLFSINGEDGTVDPNELHNIPGLELLRTADMMVILAMDLELPDKQMKHLVEYVEAGKPVLGFRCSLLAFKYNKNKDTPYARFDAREKNGGFGERVLGERWRGHHGHHGHESTRGLVHGPNRDHPILHGVHDVWGPTDVYRIDRLPPGTKILMHGQVLRGMNPEDAPNLQKPIMPMVWVQEKGEDSGERSRTVTSTIGAAQDLESEDLRRLIVNSIYWGTGLEAQIQKKANVDYIGEFSASPFGRNKFQKGRQPEDFEIRARAK